MGELLDGVAGSDQPARTELSSHFSRSYFFFGINLSGESDDPSLFEEFEAVFGCGDQAPLSSRGALRTVLRRSVLEISGDDLEDPAGFLAGFSSPDIPLTLIDPQSVRVGDDGGLVIRFSGSSCHIPSVPGWQRIASHMIFLRLIRALPNLLFFHAASIGIRGRGFLLVGPKGRGKTTVSLALAARGHAFLGDETAVYEPATARLLPFHRPVGIKPGPRSQSLDARLQRIRMPQEGIARLPIGKLIDVPPPEPMALRGVIFLQPFADRPYLEPIASGREELGQLQPLASTLQAGAATQRVFAMIRLLSATRCYKLWPANPDETATYLERTLIDES